MAETKGKVGEPGNVNGVAARDSPHKWKPGQSGNPGGPPKGILKLVRQEFGPDVPAIMRVFRDLVLGKVPSGYEDVEIKTSDRIKAGTEVLDRIGVTAQRQLTVTSEPAAPQVIDVSKLTDEQLEAIAAIEFVEAEMPSDGTTEH